MCFRTREHHRGVRGGRGASLGRAFSVSSASSVVALFHVGRRVMMTFRTAALLSAALWLAPVAQAGAQTLSYNSGQPIAPAYEGWEEEPDGSKYFLFGYMNRNWEEELVVPVGPRLAESPPLRASPWPTCPASRFTSTRSRSTPGCDRMSPANVARSSSPAFPA